MSAQRILYVFTQAPYSNSSGIEALDALLIGAAFEQDVSVLFLHNGVFQLKADQVPSEGIKAFTKTFKALEDFGVNDIYVDQLSLISRGLTASQLMCDVTELTSGQVQQLLAEQYRVFTF